MIFKKVQKELARLKNRLFGSNPKDKLIEEMQYELDNLPYELYDKIKQGACQPRLPKIKSIDETLDKIIHNKCSISRFGDGEFACMNCSRIAYHDPSKELAERLKEVLLSDVPELLVGLLDCFGSLDCYVPYTRKFWRKWMFKKRKMVYSYLDMNTTYYNAFFNRCYLNYNKTDEYYQRCCSYFKQLKEIWRDRDVVLLESPEARLGVTNDILEGAKSVSRIIFCPPRNSFNKYKEILSAFDDVRTDALILLSLGPTATVLAYDLCRKGYQAIDFGQINEEYECFLRKEKPLESENMKRKRSLRHASNPNDPKYKKQIIKIIG
jgi:glycosyltransferase family protein